MHIPCFAATLLVTLLAGPLYAQTPAKPLNLKLPTTTLPIIPSHAASTASTANAGAPGVYYGDTSGRRYNTEALKDTPRSYCDDSTYNKPQVHGDVGVGVAGGNHVSGNYQAGTVNWSKAFGSCSQPAGGINISVSVGRGEFHGHDH